MNAENAFSGKSDNELLDAARQLASEAQQRGLALPNALGEIADHGAGVTNPHDEDVDPFLEPASEAAKAYAHEKTASGWPRWMESFSKVDMFGKPTVFSDRYDPLDRRM